MSTHNCVTYSPLKYLLWLQSQRLPTISHWKMVQHPTCFWVIFSMQYAEHITENESLQHTYVQSSLFPANILCHFKVSSGLEHDCTFIGSSEEFSVESVRINHSSISGEADKPVRNKPKAKDRTLYKLAYELLCIPQTQWIQENRQVFITIFMHRIKHLLQTENSIFFFLLSWMSP